MAFADIDIEAAQKAVDESKKHASNPEYQSIAIQIDISKKDDCDEMVNTIIENFGRLDYAANCAGVNTSCDFSIVSILTVERSTSKYSHLFLSFHRRR